MRERTKFIIAVVLFLFLNMSIIGQKRLAEFPFNAHTRAINVNTAIGFGQFQVKVASSDVLTQAPVIYLEDDEVTRSMFFRFSANYSSSVNNISIALAPKAGNKIKVTHIEFRIRFGSNNRGNAGIFISKDPETIENTLLWTCGNNNTFRTYKDFVVPIPDSELNYSESVMDSIRFVFAQGTNTDGMYLDNFELFGIVNDESNATVNLSIDVSDITKELADRPSGANACWLMDSDHKWPRDTSNEERFATMKLGALRFPYGHLADNYLWHTPGDYSNLDVTEPTPRVGSLHQSPAKWEWAVEPAGGTFLKAMSFDEFIAICKRQNIEPLIVVNVASFSYKEGPTYEVLKTSAAEWVRYANITKKYGVKYWQLGNEVEHKGVFNMDEYTDLFIDFASAMKAVDPTIQVGTGVLKNTNWNRDVLNKAGDLCDFIATHNYQHASSVPSGGFRSWYKTNSVFVTNTVATQSMLDSHFSDRPKVEVHVTETGIGGSEPFPDEHNIDLYKALYWFEMNMNHLALKNIKYTYFWGTHSPWSGENDPGGYNCLLENSNANTIRPAGRVIQLINTYLKSKWVNTARVNGNIRFYASVTDDGKEMSVFLLNKNLYPEKVNLNVANFNMNAASTIEKIRFSGNHFNDTEPVISTESLVSVSDEIELLPYSLTIFNIRHDNNTNIVINQAETLAYRFDGENLTIQTAFVHDVHIKCHRIDGSVMMAKDFPATGEKIISFSNIESGIYILSVQSGNKKETIKIIK